MKKYESLKKVDLHCHLEGSLNPVKVSKWTRKSIGEAESALILETAGDMENYKAVSEYAVTLLQTKARLKEAAQELCKELKNENVVYAEIRLDPYAHLDKDLTMKEVVEATLEGLSSSTLKANLILTMNRKYDFETNKSIIDLAKKFLKKGVCAVDLVGPGNGNDVKPFKELFIYAVDTGVPYVIHTGEHDFRGIDSAISYGAKRIGHGVKAITSFETMEKLKKHKIPLEICLTANMATGLYRKYSDHPVQRLIDSGVMVTINTDNRTVNKTSLTDEYNLLNKYFGLTIKDFNEMNKIAIEHSFLSDEEKKDLLVEFI